MFSKDSTLAMLLSSVLLLLSLLSLLLLVLLQLKLVLFPVIDLVPLGRVGMSRTFLRILADPNRAVCCTKGYFFTSILSSAIQSVTWCLAPRASTMVGITLAVVIIIVSVIIITIIIIWIGEGSEPGWQVCWIGDGCRQVQPVCPCQQRQCALC